MQKYLQTYLPLFILSFYALITPPAFATDWSAIEAEAKGQTVYFNAWGGDENINAYLQWVAKEAEKRYQINLEHVKVTDVAEVVKRIQTEKAAGRTQEGSVDLIWVNGENFSILKRGELLFGPWAESLPNWQYVDTNKPVRHDFSESTDGLEAPWGSAQLTLIANKTTLDTPPQSAIELLALAEKNKGRITYPKPPMFIGTTFLKQVLSEVITDKTLLQQPVTEATFAQASAPLWAYLDKLHAVAWREGKAFPINDTQMDQQLADNELLLSMTFNPNKGANAVASGALPPSTYSFGFASGMIGNIHFVAIPFNAKAKAGAQVLANFLLSPEAQARKADRTIWGDPSILDARKLDSTPSAVIHPSATGGLMTNVPTLLEPHASWVEALEAEWTKRYGG